MTLRRPIFLAAVLLVAFGGLLWWPEPSWSQEVSEGADYSSTIADLLKHLVGPALPIIGLGLLGAWGAGGARSLRSAARYLLGGASDAECLQAHRALSAAARTTVSAGLVLGLLGGTAAFLLVSSVYRSPEGVSPANLAYVINLALLAPVTALAVGRLVLGVAADAAAVDAGTPERRTFGRRDDFMLLLYMLSPIMVFTVAVWPVPEVQ